MWHVGFGAWAAVVLLSVGAIGAWAQGPPGEVWVRFGETGPGDGSEEAPYASLAEGLEPVVEGGLVRLQSDAEGTRSAETPRVAKPMRVQAEGGTARIGDQSVYLPFEEEGPTWGRPELALTSLAAEPPLADPGASVFLLCRVENVGNAPAPPATVDFYVDGDLVGQRPVPLLEGHDQASVRTAYTVDLPGTFAVRAEIRYDNEGEDKHTADNVRTAVLRVTGEESPEPAFDLDLVLSEGSELPEVGGHVDLDLVVRNPGAAGLDGIPVQMFIDDVLVHEDHVAPLGPEEEDRVTFPWDAISEGVHHISVEMALPDGFPYAEFKQKWVWDTFIPGPTGSYPAPGLHQWASIGPSFITNGVDGMPSGSVGRIDAIVPHPTDPLILYAGAPTGGVWRSRDGGDSWTPVGDLLPALAIGSMALDPGNPDILYACTGSSSYSGGLGIFKSLDAGDTWTQFAGAAHIGWTDRSIGGASRIVIRRPAPGQVLIYVGSDVGVLRYTSGSPSSAYSGPGEWTQLLPGRIADLDVHPTDDDILYASVVSDGLYKTTTGRTASGASDWTQLLNGLPAIDTTHPKAPGGDARTGQAWQTAVFEALPDTVYAALPNPLGAWENQPRLGVYRSTNGGTNWASFVTSSEGGLYSPFLAAHPTFNGLIYFGGVKLYRYIKTSGFLAYTLGPDLVQGIHDDMHDFVWDPTDVTGKRYYAGGDGGIWRCAIVLPGGDVVKHRNTDLRVTMFWDFDASQTDPNMMLGGTQDNGTILYQGNADWKCVKGGDGAHSLIGRYNQYLYAQHQWIETTVRCNQGGSCSHTNWVKASTGLLNKDGGRDWYVTSAQIAVDPDDPARLAAQGTEVQLSENHGDSWAKIGPASAFGHIARVAFQPVRRRVVAGTSDGAVWVRYEDGPTPVWECVHDPSDWRARGTIRSMAFSPVDHQVLYIVTASYDAWARLCMLRIQDTPHGATARYITGDLPTHHFVPYWPKAISDFQLLCVSGDGHSALTAYVGTDRGVYRGTAESETAPWTWERYGTGLPNVRVMDLLVDPASRQLRAATYGRGAWAAVTGLP